MQISLAFSVHYEGTEGDVIWLLNENTVESVVLLSKKYAKNFVEIGVDAEDYYRIKEK